MGTAKFDELRDKRLGIVVAKARLLQNLRRAEYKPTTHDLEYIATTLEAAAADFRTACKLPVRSQVPPPPPAPPSGGGTPVDGHDRAEIRRGLAIAADGNPKTGFKIIRKVALGWIEDEA